jgi:hypothetical protein
MGELFPNAMKRWPRTFMLGLVMLSASLAIGALVCSVYVMGFMGPFFLGLGAFIYTIFTAVRGDIRDRREP